MNRIAWTFALGTLAWALSAAPGLAQSSSTINVSEDFTGATTTNSWYFFNGACLTASQSAATSNPGTVPGCTTLSSYYNENLVGGYNGVAGGSVTLPDTPPNGALRFTNGCIPPSTTSTDCGSGGHSQNGLIISGDTFPAGEGVEITFKTVTYRGDSGGNGAGCPSGSTASDGQCVTTTSIAATATYSCPSGYTSSGSGSSMTCTKTASPTKHSNGDYYCPSGYSPSGQVTSTTTCTETASATATYSCSSGYTLSGSNCNQTTVVLATDPHQDDGADGMSFFLMDGSQPVTFTSGSSTVGNYGSWGGSLGYTCSNTNTPYNGLVGAYVGLGIDEYGNFLNGMQNTLGVSNPQSLGDNTASGGGQWANRIGLRGAGNVSWYWLNANYPTYYPSSLTTAQQETAVQSTCETGTLWNYSTPSAATNTGVTSVGSGPVLYDYQAIPSGWEVLAAGPSGVQIANEYATGGYARGNATPIMYKLQITQNGLLSLQYSVNGGSWLGVISNQSITASNGPLPSTLRFGFAGSTGGSSNIHEILCFTAAPATQSSSSTTANEKQSARVESGTQAYFAYYNPDDWTGRLAAYGLSASSSGALSIASAANWDASCVLTGVTSCPTTGADGPTSAEPWQTGTSSSGANGRVILSWDGAEGIPFEWSSGITTAQQTALSAETLLDYLRGDRSNEINSSGSGLYRARDAVLSDIIDSSPTWVGAPSSSYSGTWQDRLYPSATMPENSATQNYSAFTTAYQTRENVVYIGANDGLVHGFRSGSFDSSGNFVSTDNDGYEVLAYMPAAVVNTIHNTTNTNLDYPNPQYGHNFYVDAAPGTGDLFYEGAWHTWVVGGLGPGGSAIYALDVTDPTTFSETNASSLVVGEWSSSSISCATGGGGATCGQNLGNTYGTPVIRRLHNGDWAVIFGNGVGSSTGDAGIYIMTIDPSTAAETFYYLSTGTGTAASPSTDGIEYVAAADLDGDHITDYVYAGDLLGNVWRFDLTSNDPTQWAVTPGPLFTTSAGQPITTQPVVALISGNTTLRQVLVAFGTGRKYPLTNTSAASYAPGTQAIYGVWDWNMTTWNQSSLAQFASLSSSATGLGAPYTLTPSNLQSQTPSTDSSGNIVVSTTATICWAGGSACTPSNSNDMFGWYLSLPGSDEQIIYNPQLVSTALVVNSIVPANNPLLSCTTNLDSGYTYAVSIMSGGASSGFFETLTDSTTAIAEQTGATGGVFLVTTTPTGTSGSGSSGSASSSSSSSGGSVSGSSSSSSSNSGGYQVCSSNVEDWLVFQKISGSGGTLQVNPQCNISGYRRTWIQFR